MPNTIRVCLRSSSEALAAPSTELQFSAHSTACISHCPLQRKQAKANSAQCPQIIRQEEQQKTEVHLLSNQS